MTPAARLSAAIDILDRVLAGNSAEQALTNWGRASRFAGSGDRLAVRDLVFAAIRCRRSFAALGGAETGRGLVLGGLRDAGVDPGPLFTGQGHAPPPLTEADSLPPTELPDLVALDCPDWLAPPLRAALGADFAPVMAALRARASVFLRVNSARISREGAIAALASEGIAAQPHGLSSFALEVTENARKIQSSQTYLTGLVELQDAASQAVVQALPLRSGQRVLDYCAGGGGKTLAMAAAGGLQLFAHDANPRRMRDLPARAERAGVRLRLLETADLPRHAPFDLVLTDVPCSGSGSWRRAPEAKWALTPARLAELCRIQAGILDRVAPLVAPGGHLAYATCSMLQAENSAQIAAFLARSPGWLLQSSRLFTPLDGGDGFFVAILRRNP
ncbi:RsmB/NOP family class I SAM-dependent RNA methyltransferase [Rhodobacter ferrooxidans]|uniref:Fmu (Sun) domain protein n=1 Tax=Rhodobacter ferrooxidans TaxID=371731 RepID=C8S0K4_9RHOB|nr:RsmB/NOP family class I SAM-dependent RNA methyltransferase [Rhodobacter sp. SW2]EEW25538.1 Fmu (Sun) domain protein [Rhodobacter sp. SW2]